MSDKFDHDLVLQEIQEQRRSEESERVRLLTADYFGGHWDPWAPHPHMTSTGSEGRCDLCGGPAGAIVHSRSLR